MKSVGVWLRGSGGWGLVGGGGDGGGGGGGWRGWRGVRGGGGCGKGQERKYARYDD